MVYLVQSITLRELIKLVPFVSGILYHKFKVQDTKGCNTMQKEIWLPVVDYEGRYEISNLGKVKSLFKHFRKEKLLKPYFLLRKTHQYANIGLTKNNKAKAFPIHRLVAIAFIPNPLNKKEVNHIDNNPINNCVENLEWVTHRENIEHSIRQNRHQHGEISARAKLKNKDIIEIRSSNLSHIDISKIYNVDESQISRIRNYKSWKHIT